MANSLTPGPSTLSYKLVPSDLQDPGLQRLNNKFLVLQQQQVASATVTTSTASSIIEDTHANRVNYPAAKYPNELYYETDSLVTYISRMVSGSLQWAYYTGYQSMNQSAIAPFILTGGSGGVSGVPLGVLDTFYQIFVADYAHFLVWTGNAFTFLGNDCSGFIVLGPTPIGGVWYPCDGGTHSVLQGDGTTTAIATPAINENVAGLFGGGYGTTLNGATGLTVGTSAVSAGSGINAITFIQPSTLANGGLPPYFTMSAWLRA